MISKSMSTDNNRLFPILEQVLGYSYMRIGSLKTVPFKIISDGTIGTLPHLLQLELLQL
jgi:hypothetical protein